MTAQFKEICRTTVNGTRDIVISKVVEDGEVKGFNINSYVTTNKYTGFTQGGVFVPVEKLQDFGELVKTALAS